MSSGPVAQQPSRKKPVRGSAEHSRSRPPITFLSGCLSTECILLVGQLLSIATRKAKKSEGRAKTRQSRPGRRHPATTPYVKRTSRQLGLALIAVLMAVAVPAAANGDASDGASAPCTGDLTAAGVPQAPGRHLRMGINPAGRAGALGPPVPLTPI